MCQLTLIHCPTCAIPSPTTSPSSSTTSLSSASSDTASPPTPTKTITIPCHPRVAAPCEDTKVLTTLATCAACHARYAAQLGCAIGREHKERVQQEWAARRAAAWEEYERAEVERLERRYEGMVPGWRAGGVVYC